MSQKPPVLAFWIAVILTVFFIILSPLDTLVMAVLFVSLLVLLRIFTAH